MHLAREELYLLGMKCPLQPQAQSCRISKAKLSGRRGGELSPKKLLQSRSASRAADSGGYYQRLGYT